MVKRSGLGSIYIQLLRCSSLKSDCHYKITILQDGCQDIIAILYDVYTNRVIIAFWFFCLYSDDVTKIIMMMMVMMVMMVMMMMVMMVMMMMVMLSVAVEVLDYSPGKLSA